MHSTEQAIGQRIAEELNVQLKQVNAAVGLLDEGATVPFISRYRKEVTGGLDDSQMRALEERLGYLRDMEDRRATVLKSIAEQGKLTPALEKAIASADTKTRLEDLYLPYKPKRRTKGQVAIEAGLEPLADALFSNPTLDPETVAADYLNTEKGVADTKAALDGARFILMERFAESADLLGRLRDFLYSEAQLSSTLVPGKEQEGAKFKDYFEHTEPLRATPSHRALAMLRGRREGFLNLCVDLPTTVSERHHCEVMVAEQFGIEALGRAADRWLADVVRWTWKIKLHLHLETDLLGDLRDKAEQDAIAVFATNLNDLLLAAPAGQKVTMGLDPGLRTGVKVAVIDATGKVLDHCAIFPTPPQNKVREAEATLVTLCKKHRVQLIAIGNGTASRETERFVKDMLNSHSDLKAQSVMVNEAGASIYSASEFAAREFPDLDVTIRGAISIARRLQDPLAELVKIEPKSIGVGQYQHDVSQVQLAQSLDAVIEDCVNAVGVEVNTASAALLRRVSGLNQGIAENIVALRDSQGAFQNRDQLRKVPRLGDKTFEQAAGFLRIANGDNPLDASAVHPESYAVVERIASVNTSSVSGLISNGQLLRKLQPSDYADARFGVPTVTDIIAELDKPGRDPRPEFKTATFKDGIEKISDLEPGMTLEGTVTNVTSFGAFVDVGVHQDGLVHISALADKFVKDPREVVKTGDIVNVKVAEVDVQRKRIGLTMRLDDDIQSGSKSERGDRPQRKKSSQRRDNNVSSSKNASTSKKASTGKSRGKAKPSASQGTMAALFAQAANNKNRRL